MKTCQKCKTEKSLDGFYKHKQTKDGYETTCKQCKKDAAASWSKDNKENRIAIVKRYNQSNPDRRKETLAKYYQANKEHLNERVKTSRAKNKELYAELGRTHSNRRRARKFENGYEAYTEKQMIEAYGLLCNICNEPINLTAPRKVGTEGWELGLHIDHVVPISKGGPDSLDNVRPAHGICNTRKGSSMLE